MPYYIWTALDINGQTFRGLLFANNVNDLEKKLFIKNLGLIHSQQTYSLSKLILSKKDTAQAIKDIAHLLRAKIPVYQAFQLVASMQKNTYLKDVLSETADTLYTGSSLDTALSWHEDIINSTMLGLVRAGQETGKLSETLDKIAEHALLVERLKAQLRSLLFMPAITFGGFIVLLCVFLMSIVPRFEQFLQASDGELPWMTIQLITMSNRLLMVTPLQIMLLVSLGILLIYVFMRYVKDICSQLLFAIGLGSLVITWNIAYVLQLLAILVSSGISLLPSLSLCAQSIHNKLISNDLRNIQHAVAQGMQITIACSQSRFFAQQDLQAILGLGESSAELAIMLQQAADVYQLRAHRAIKRWITISQPIALIVLGALIAGLLYCLYVPIFTMSHIVM